MFARSSLAVHPSVYQWGDCFWQGGSILAAKINPGRQILAAKIGPGDHFFAKIGPGDHFGEGGNRFWCDRPMKSTKLRGVLCSGT